jgi:hypothetical protein
MEWRRPGRNHHADSQNSVAGVTYCLAPPGAARLTVPRELLAHLPVGPGQLLLGTWQAPPVEDPPGIDRTIALSVYGYSARIRIR